MQDGGTLVIRNGSVLLAGGGFRECDVRIERGLIAEIGAGLSGAPEIDASGAYVLPGIIDLHTHGIGDVSADDASLEQWAALEASFGATTFYSTLFAPAEDMAAQMRQHRQETDDLKLMPQVGGFRLESPYLGRAGGGMTKALAPVSDSTTDLLLDAGGGLVKIWDISPELPGAVEAIARLSGAGVVCSIAHTRASIDQARAAVDAGARLVTHLFDTFELPEMTEPGAYPAGLVDYLLIEDRLVCEIIADGLHVHPILVEKAFRCKTASRIAFVTDSNRGAGLPPGRYSLGDWGEVEVRGPSDGLRLVERDMILAGSAMTSIAALQNAVRLFGRTLAEASELCSKTPARLMGLNKGEIDVGTDGDVILLDSELNLMATVVRGRVAFRK